MQYISMLHFTQLVPGEPYFKYLLLAATRVRVDFRLLGNDSHEEILNKPFLRKQLQEKAAVLAQLILSLETSSE